MTRIALMAILLLNLTFLNAQPSTEIYIFDLTIENDLYRISNPTNISRNPGYDNQPFFLPDGSGLLYASNRGEQTDVYKYDLTSGDTQQITDSEGSEYSPTVDPTGKYFSTIILEKDGTQLLWRYSIYGGKRELLIPDSKVGYHCWLDHKTIATFVLGDPPTLELFDSSNSKKQILTKNIGRSLHKIPDTELISYVSKIGDDWIIKSLDPVSGESKSITNTLKKSEDLTWTKDGTILMGKDEKLYQYNPEKNNNWI
ncbi:MAG: hypothetical protein AAFN93_10930, partial [Bacteroidota bacterium]